MDPHPHPHPRASSIRLVHAKILIVVMPSNIFRHIRPLISICLIIKARPLRHSRPLYILAPTTTVTLGILTLLCHKTVVVIYSRLLRTPVFDSPGLQEPTSMLSHTQTSRLLTIYTTQASNLRPTH